MNHGRASVPHILCILFMVVSSLQVCFATDPSESSQDVTVCDGEAASFAWPCDLQYDLTKVMTLAFNGFGIEGKVVASIFNNGTFTAAEEYFGRVRARGTSGIRLDDAGILDSGIYVTKAEFHNGTVKERQFTLHVHVPPLLSKNTLTLEVVNTSRRCQKVTCGHVVFPGFPAASFTWNTQTGSQSFDSTDGESSMHGCPLTPGSYICELTGPAVACRAPHNAAATLSVSAQTQISMAAIKAAAARSEEDERRDLILMIVVPIVSVMTPLVILGLWLLSHLLSGYPSDSGKDDTEEGMERAGEHLAEATGDVMTVVTFHGLSAPVSTPVVLDSHAATSSALETVPLTGAVEEEEEEGREQASVHDQSGSGEEFDHNDEEDPSAPLVGAESFRSNFIDVEGADDTRL